MGMPFLFLLCLLITSGSLSASPSLPKEFARRNSQALRLMGLHGVEPWLKRATRVRVAVIDSGVSLLNPDLSPYLLIDATAKNYDFVEDRDFQLDDHGHGTHVSSIIASLNPKVQILSLKVLNAEGKGKIRDILDAIYYAVDHGAKVINLSLGALDVLASDRVAFESAMDWAKLHKVLVVAAAGNHSSDNDQFAFYPSNVMQDNLLSVCAVDDQSRLASFSNYGAWRVHLCAPGVKIWGLGNPNVLFPWHAQSGTSQAAPAVTALASLIYGLNPDLEPYQVRDAILNGRFPHPHLQGKSQTAGILHFAATLNLLFPQALLHPVELFEKIRY